MEQKKNWKMVDNMRRVFKKYKPQIIEGLKWLNLIVCSLLIIWYCWLVTIEWPKYQVDMRDVVGYSTNGTILTLQLEDGTTHQYPIEEE